MFVYPFHLEPMMKAIIYI